jgi:hypothetical protein
VAKGRGWTLDEVVTLLNANRQRATYGAVAGVCGLPVRRLMTGRTGWYENSWVVAASSNRESGSRRGRATGYRDDQIHPDCLEQLRHTPNDFIADADDLRRWLETVS